MVSEQAYREWISGRRRGWAAAAIRCLLLAATLPYGLAVRLRNWRYDLVPSAVSRAAIPVVSVGNLTVGGTGKTPLVAWLARWFRRREVRVAIVSRGYGAAAGSRNDEALELERQLPDVPHLQNPDRVAAAAAAFEELESQLILLDDGFQHRRLHRDLDLVLIDASNPFGYGHLLPRGLLREPLGGLRRADVVLLTRADMVDADARQRLRERVARIAPRADWVEIAHRPVELCSAAGATLPLAAIRGKPVAAFCGIGNPAGFFHSLSACGAEVAATRELPDHHRYTRDDVEALHRWATGTAAEAVVCTRKDLVKLGIETLGERPLWALAVDIELLAGEDALERRLAAVADAIRTSAPPTA